MGVRVPRITLKADFGDESAFGELSMLSVGYGLHQAWVFVTMFGTASAFGAAHTFSCLTLFLHAFTFARSYSWH